jgi:arylsulfatase
MVLLLSRAAVAFICYGIFSPFIALIEADPREEVNVLGTNVWVVGSYLKAIGEYLKTLEKYPNPKPVRLTEFGK